ncbi:MAG: hypothetical protein A4S17_14655 [Proteobacteria bacterium HN_bin10]|nr:MAG: hypothetical protein A4S17_14655 [Proteobacteria bacterium HN_bin10]
MPQVYKYRGYEIELRETGEAFVALFKTDAHERPVMVTATVPKGMDLLRARVRLLIDFEFERRQ